MPRHDAIAAAKRIVGLYRIDTVVTRVSAREIESIVLRALRERYPEQGALADRTVITGSVDRIVLRDAALDHPFRQARRLGRRRLEGCLSGVPYPARSAEFGLKTSHSPRAKLKEPA